MGLLGLSQNTWRTILALVAVAVTFMLLKPFVKPEEKFCGCAATQAVNAEVEEFNGGGCGCGGASEGVEGFCGGANAENADGDDCAYPYGRGQAGPFKEAFSTCYRRKQIYLNSVNPDNPACHADVHLERRWDKLYVNIQANLPYAEGGVFNTAFGAYHAFLVDTHSQKSISLGSLVRHGDRFYKLATELLGDYSNYNQIRVYRQTEDYQPTLVLAGNIDSQQCSSL